MESSGDDHKGKGELSSSDLSLWKRFTSDINPFHDTDWEKEELAAQTADQKKGKGKPREEAVFDLSLESKRKPSPEQPPQLDRRTEERFRKGRMDIEGTLDMHGMRQAEAQSALAGFITAAHESGKRCLLVVTGKGERSGREDREWYESAPGVLKKKTPEWLSSAPLKDKVLKYAPAQKKHGGDGALYIYLKRRRDY